MCRTVPWWDIKKYTSGTKTNSQGIPADRLGILAEAGSR